MGHTIEPWDAMRYGVGQRVQVLRDARWREATVRHVMPGGVIADVDGAEFVAGYEYVRPVCDVCAAHRGGLDSDGVCIVCRWQMGER